MTEVNELQLPSSTHMDSIHPNASLNVKEDQSEFETKGNLTNIKSETPRETHQCWV